MADMETTMQTCCICDTVPPNKISLRTTLESTECSVSEGLEEIFQITLTAVKDERRTGDC